MENKIFSNSLWLIVSQVLTKTIGFFYTVFLAQSLGVDIFGQFIVALSYFALLSAVADFGITRYLVRELAVNPKNSSSLISSSVICRFILLVFSIMVYIGLIGVIDTDLDRRELSMLAALAVLPQSVSLTLDAVLTAFLKVRLSAFSTLLFSILTALSGLVLISFGWGKLGAMTALIIGQFFYMLILLFFVSSQKISWLGEIDGIVIKRVLRGSLPYGLLGIIGIISFRVDTLFLAYFRGNFETGIYGAAYKFLDASTLLPISLATVFFPVAARLHELNIKQAKNLYYSILKINFLVGVVIVLGYLTILPIFITYFMPKYLPSIDVLKILSFSIPFIFMHILAGQVLLSTARYLKQVLVMYAPLLLINLVLYSVFIPTWGYFGAAGATVIGEILTFFTFSVFIWRKVFTKD